MSAPTPSKEHRNTMTTAYSPDSFLLGGGITSAFGKNDAIGKTVTGVICEAPEVRQQTDLADGKPLTWDDGQPKMQLVVTLQTQERDPANGDDDGKRRLYVKGSSKAGSKSLHDAVATAVRNAGAKGIEVGGTLTVRYVGTEPSSTRGFSDRKLYEATYAAPDRAAQTGAFLGTTQAPVEAPAPQAWPAADQGPAPFGAAAAPAAAPAPAPTAPAPAAAADPVVTARQLISLGQPDHVIAAATGLPGEVIASLRNLPAQ